MKKLIMVMAVALISSTAFAGGFMSKDADGAKTQSFSPDGTSAALLTVNSTVTDLTNRFMFSVIGTAATCKMRLMPTIAKGDYVAISIPAAVYTTFVVNKATPFLNLSGCTAGYSILQ